MKIQNANLKFKGELEKRKFTKKLIIHHTGETVLQTVQQIHNFYLTRDGGTYSGIGYNLYIRKNGEVWRGRPIDAVGAHCHDNNHDSIGICFEGNYEVENMSLGQFQAGVEAIRYILGIYPKLLIDKHNDYNATDCPGVNFPFDKMVAESIAVIAPKPPVVVKPKPATPAKPAAKKLAVGAKIMITGVNAVYGGASKGVKIGSKYKNKAYTVSQLGTGKTAGLVLIKELFSWVYIKDIKII